MTNKYDVIIVGAGPSGVFAALELVEKKPNLKILMLEKGDSIEKRSCPKRHVGKCINCKNCAITTGFGGAGTFSDGKLTLASSETGGILNELIDEDLVKQLIKRVDDIYLSFGADPNLYGVDVDKVKENIRRKAIKSNMKLVDSPIRHLGTESAYNIYGAIQDKLIKNGVVIKFNTMVEKLLKDDTENKITGVVDNNGTEYYSDVVIVGSGREGSAWFKKICHEIGVKSIPGTVDIGVRVECRNEVMEELNKLYESKLIYHAKTYADKVRTFCQNPGGEVALENYNLPNGEHITTVNGHSYKGDELKTNNTNFALLVSKNFTEPFKEPLEYGAMYAKAANMLAGGKVLVQTYGDIKRARRSTPERIRYGNVTPTLKDAEAGDLSLVLPHRIMVDLIEMIEALDEVAPGIASDETLLYGIEVKFYSNKVLVDEHCETNIHGLYAIGDSSGWTRGLMMASANGLYVADCVLGLFK